MVLLLVAVLLITGSSNAESIRIASFNIAQFGEGTRPQHRDLPAMATMLTGADLDLVCIQEVGTNTGGDGQVAALTAAMNNAATNSTQYFSDVLPISGDERCAVIYRSPVVQEGELFWLDDDKDPNRPQDGGKIYAHIPVAVPFHADDFDFYVVILHLTASDKKRRAREVRDLRRFLRVDDSDESDWIVLGDMNRYLSYSKKSKSKAFDQLLGGQWKRNYRFPLLEAITDPHDMKVWRASTDSLSTTVAKKNNIYDQFIITAGAFHEFGTDDPQLGVHVGIIPFDMDQGYLSMDHNQVKFAISDHRPIWIKMEVDLGDDD
jgi:endonuclease/exonuclease/phosphatase family metal-dependent hydrolase